MGFKTNQQMSEFQGWLTMLRISNAPTIVSNVMVGLALALHIHLDTWSQRANPPRLEMLKPVFIITGALLLVYFAGMILNDAIDAARDKKHRSERPIPLGVINTREAWCTGFVMLTCGVLISSLCSVETFVLVSILGGLVVLYTFVHTWLLPAIAIMAACRGLVCLAALSAFHIPVLHGLPLSLAVAIAAYTLLLTLIGRFENSKKSRYSWLTWLLLLPVCIPAVLSSVSFDLSWIFLAMYAGWICLAWLDFRPSINQTREGMHKLLAGFCLLDCVLIAFAGVYTLVLVSGVCFVLTVALHRKILGT